jgi:hypothetical protein
MLKVSSKPLPQTIETKLNCFPQLHAIQTPKYQASRKNTYDLERKAWRWSERYGICSSASTGPNFFLLKISLELISETMKSPKLLKVRN